MKNHFELLESNENFVKIKGYKPLYVNFLLWYFVLFILWYGMILSFAALQQHNLFTVEKPLPLGLFAKFFWAVTRIEFFLFIGWYMPLMFIRIYQRLHEKYFGAQLIEIDLHSASIKTKGKSLVKFSEIESLKIDVRKEGYPDTISIYLLAIDYPKDRSLTLYESKDLAYIQNLARTIASFLKKTATVSSKISPLPEAES